MFKFFVLFCVLSSSVPPKGSKAESEMKVCRPEVYVQTLSHRAEVKSRKREPGNEGKPVPSCTTEMVNCYTVGA